MRGNDVEETAEILLRFAAGLTGGVNACDVTLPPWIWELTARENLAYPASGQDCSWIGGTDSLLSLPNLVLWAGRSEPSWWKTIFVTNYQFEFADSLVCQSEQFGPCGAGWRRPGRPRPRQSGRGGGHRGLQTHRRNRPSGSCGGMI